MLAGGAPGIVAAIIAGLVLLIVGAVGTLWPRRTVSGDVLEVELPWSIKVKSNVMAIGIMLVGGGLIVGAGWTASRATPTFPVSGTITLDDGRPAYGISIGFIPPQHHADTQTDGRFSTELPKLTDDSGSYQAVVYYRDRDRLRAEIAKVDIDRHWNGRVEHRFERQ